MKKGKSNFTFVVNAPEQEIHNLIQSFLSANGFCAKNENGVLYYQSFDAIWGNRFFEYYVQYNQVTILAYIGTYKKPLLLDNSFAGTAPKSAYKDVLNNLFNALNAMNANGGSNQWQQAGYATPDYGVQGNTMGQQAPAMGMNQQANQFTQQVDKSKEKMAIAGFIISIVGLLLSCVGYTFGAIIIALEIYFAVQGLKTSKKGFSIATFVICGVSVLVLIVEFALVLLT